MEPDKNINIPAKPLDVEMEEGPIRVVRSDEPLSVRPTGAWVVVSWTLAMLFLLLSHLFFDWLSPHAQTTVSHLKGFPVEWADLFLKWSERFLGFAAILSAGVHTAWRQNTRYHLNGRTLEIHSRFPERRLESVPLSSIVRTGYSQSLMGWALDYGHVDVDLGGVRGPVILRNCPKPEAFLRELQKRIDA